MEIEKDSNREAFESWFESRYDANFMQFALDLDMYVDKHTQKSWEAWQAAKAQAVPEGFVVVPKEPTDEMLFAASGRDIVAEHYGGENIMWSEVRETWKAMLEAAQEPAND